jgi:hypothetical protein
MTSAHKTGTDPESDFSFGVRELRQAQTHSADVAPLEVVTDEDRGVDPYNTSGSFDRNKDWARVGKRYC